jgi:hypothetical protein
MTLRPQAAACRQETVLLGFVNRIIPRDRIIRPRRMVPVASMLHRPRTSHGEAAAARCCSGTKRQSAPRKAICKPASAMRCEPGSVRAMVQALACADRDRMPHAGQRENEVRHFVSIGVAAVLLCGGSMAAKADYARGAREHRMFRAGFPPGWPSICPRGYYARCSPFRCWCVVT